MTREESQERSTQPRWETLPPPSPVPLTKAQPYDSPRENSPDPFVLRLYARRSSWVMAAWLSLWPVVLIVMLATSGAPVQPYVIAALFVCGASYGWYRLLLPRCLRIDSEGLEFSGVGAHPKFSSIPWAEIDSLRLEIRAVSKSWEVLHLVAQPTRGGALWSGPDTVVDLSLGITDFDRVDSALRAYSPPGYFAARSDLLF